MSGILPPDLLDRLRAGMIAAAQRALSARGGPEPEEPRHPDRPAETPEQAAYRASWETAESSLPALPQGVTVRRSPGVHLSEEACSGHAAAQRWGTACGWCARRSRWLPAAED